MLVILQSSLSIFVLILIGIIAQIVVNKKKTKTEIILCKIGINCHTWTEVLNKFVLYLALPALIFMSLSSISTGQLISTKIILINAVILAIFIPVLILASKFFKAKKDIANAYIFGAFFGNVAYIGFPFVGSVIPGSEPEISILVAIHVLIAFTIGLFYLEHSKSSHHGFKSIIKKIIMNPLIGAVLFGLIALFLNINLPQILSNALSMLAASASPVVLIALGMFIADKIKFDKELWHAVAISSMKLILMPLIFIVVAITLKLKAEFDISILEAAMPVALTNFALAEIYPIDKKIIANSIIISTVLSLITLTALSVILI